MKRYLPILLVAILASACCGGSSSSDSTESTTTTTAPTPAAGDPAAQGAAAPTPVPGAATPTPMPGTVPGAVPGAAPGTPPVIPPGAAHGTISLSTGFMPDPSTANGTAGGPVDASTHNAMCRGWISAQPSHLFVAQTAFGNLRVMAHANGENEDLTLVIRKPDGTYLCGDDSAEGFDPLVNGPFPAGTYQIWVGSYAANTNINYRIGLSELESVTPAGLAN